MIVLALDTTTREGSCAIARGGHDVREQAGDAARPQDVRLPGELVALLEREGVLLREVDVYAVATGPGSFTGLRVGIATMQGLAFAAGKPLIGVSALDALAVIGERAAVTRDPGHEAPVIATWIDAWRGEIYASLYQSGRQIEPVTVESPDRVLARLPRRPLLFIGDGASTYAGLIRDACDHPAIADPASPLLAGTIAVLAAAAVLAGQVPAPDAIRPLYVRRSDAELSNDART